MSQPPRICYGVPASVVLVTEDLLRSLRHLSLTTSADAPDLLFQGYVAWISRLNALGSCRGRLLGRWRRQAMVVPLAVCLGGLNYSQRCNEDHQRQQKGLQQFLQTFPTVLSAWLFS
jgi:hypothetical protein